VLSSSRAAFSRRDNRRGQKKTGGLARRGGRAQLAGERQGLLRDGVFRAGLWLQPQAGDARRRARGAGARGPYRTKKQPRAVTRRAWDAMKAATFGPDSRDGRNIEAANARPAGAGGVRRGWTPLLLRRAVGSGFGPRRSRSGQGARLVPGAPLELRPRGGGRAAQAGGRSILRDARSAHPCKASWLNHQGKVTRRSRSSPFSGLVGVVQAGETKVFRYRRRGVT